MGIERDAGQRRLSPGPLLDVRGRLAEAGWAGTEVRAYDRSRVAAPRWRIKEWDYYCVLADGDDGPFGLALTVADNGYMGLLGVSWLDLAGRADTTENAMVPFPLGRLRLPASADAGDVVLDRRGMRLEFRHERGARRLIVRHPGFAGGRGLSGEVVLTSPGAERMVVAIPFPGDERAFYYNQKIPGLTAAGTITVGGRERTFDPASAFGVFDWGRGVWTYDNTWFWASASGRHEGRPFGFTVGHGFGDTAAGSENMLLLDGVAHKLDRVRFHLPHGTYDGAPWRFSSNDGRFEMGFEPILDRAADVNALVLRSTQHQVFGRFTGHVTLDDGARLEVRELLGFAEKVRNRW
ncbi:DUF2804 domain-containing protein [Rhodococcus aetherivorans]|uniref:DUF2804 domain-containing protein n=1 Tax=Rhodococcus aetherivorans TaxID=191292 RepID=UPI00045C41FF|nr:DUF2804 domain-containing protein [Rhodococcus aetherivorans]KDE11973.1 hypothetical protein N505_0116890 [Rhodococcus aetherivorans]